MTNIKRRVRSRTFAIPGLLLFGLAALASLALVSSAGAAPSTVPLASSASFAVLAGSGITNTGPTTVNGDIGTYPTTTIVGYSSITQTGGTNHGGDAVTQQAQTDLTTAYNNAAGQGPASPITADLGGLTLTPGVYNSTSSIGLTGALTLNAGGDPNAVFVFQAGSTLTTASGSQINLINGAQSCNVFWQVGSSATLGTGSTFRGSILALQSITVTTGTTVDGRVLARNGAVTLDTDTITRSTCAAATTTAATTTATPTTTTATPTTTTATPTTTTATPTTTTATPTTTTATPTTTTATPTTTTATPAPKPKPKPVVKHVVVAASATVVRARPAVRHVGLTG